MINPADRAINNANFVAAAKMIETNNIQPGLIEDVMKRELDRSRLMYAYPALIGDAITHRDASKFGYNSSGRGQSPRVCACCLESVDTQPIGLCYRTTSIKVEEEMGYQEFKLRLGISLFFSFIKMLIYYMLLRFLVADGFNALTNLMTGKYCAEQQQCYPIIWNFASLVNKRNNPKMLLIQDILSLVLVFISIIFFFFYRKNQYQITKTLSETNQSEENYTLLVENIPLIDFPSKAQAKKMRSNEGPMELYHRQHLWKYFEDKVRGWVGTRNSWTGRGGSIESDLLGLINKNNGELRSEQCVKSISLCYNLQRLETLNGERDELVRNFDKYEKTRRQIEQRNDDSALGIQQVEGDNRFSSIAKQVQFLNDCEVILNKQYASDNSVLFNITNFVGKAFISFQYQHYAEYILQEADRDINFLLFNGSRLKVSRVSNPRDIYWKNLRHTRLKQAKKSFTTAYILVLVSLLCFAGLCAIQYGRLQSQESQISGNLKLIGKITPYAFVGLQIVFLLAIGEIILRQAKSKAKGECHYSKTSESYSIIIRTVIFQFICFAILPYLVSRVFNSGIDGKTGLIFQMTCLIVAYTLLVNFASLLFPEALARSLLLSCKYRNRQPQQSVPMFQVQLNRQFQYVHFDLIVRYVNYLLIVFVASFYAYLIPVTTPILVISFFIQFWVDKLNLFTRCSHPRNFSFHLTRSIVKIFEAAIFVFACGTVLFGIYVHDNRVNPINLATLALAGIYLWFLLGSSLRLERKLFGSYESSQSLTYDDCAADGRFEETFWTENPATYLVKESDVTGRRSILNPNLSKVFVTSSRPQRTSV